MRIKLSNNMSIKINQVNIKFIDKNIYIDLFDCQFDLLEMKHVVYNHGDKSIIIRDIDKHVSLKLEYFTIVKTENTIIIKVKLHENEVYLKFYKPENDNNSILIDSL